MSRGILFAKYALVATVAAAASSAATLGAVNLIAGAQAQTAAPSDSRELMKQALSDIAGREVRIAEINRAPGADPMAHHHPGHHTFGYVIDGSYEFGINGGATQMLKAGDTFYEPPGSTHTKSRNASADKPLKMVVFFLADAKNPTTVPAK